MGEDFNQIIFCNYVWEILENEKDDKVIREFIITMNKENRYYQESGGTYPSVEYILGLAKDKVFQNTIEENTIEEIIEEIIEVDMDVDSEQDIGQEQQQESEEESELSVEIKNERARIARVRFYDKK